MTPQITILIPVYNGLPYVKDSIDSALKQTFQNFELLIIDDKSPDPAVVECIKSYDDPRIRFIQNEENLGTSDTMNKGIERALAPYIARLDHDDISLPGRLQEQYAYLEAHPDIAAVCSWEYGIDAHGNRVRNWQGRVENYGAFLGPLLFGLCPIWHPSIMFRRDIVRAVGGYKKEYQPVEDFELTMRLALIGHRAAIVPQYLVEQRHHGGRQSVTKLTTQMQMRIRVHDEMLQKYFDGSMERRITLGHFLRLEQNFWQQCHHKNDVFTVLADLERVLEGIHRKALLNDQEYATLRSIVYTRLGRGARYASRFRALPNLLFFAVFFGFSPLLSPRLRALASRCYELLHQLRYPWRLMRHGIEHRS